MEGHLVPENLSSSFSNYTVDLERDHKKSLPLMLPGPLQLQQHSILTIYWKTFFPSPSALEAVKETSPYFFLSLKEEQAVKIIFPYAYLAPITYLAFVSQFISTRQVLLLFLNS